MPITKEGNYQAQILAAQPIEPRFPDVPQPAFEIMFSVKTEHGEDGEIFLEFSNRFCKGNNQSKTQSQMSMETLAAIGWTLGGDFSRVGELAGKLVNVYTKKSADGKYTNTYFSTHATTKLDVSTLAARVAAMTGAAPAAAPAPAAASPFGGGAVAPNPFGGVPSAPVTPFGGNPFAK